MTADSQTYAAQAATDQEQAVYCAADDSSGQTGLLDTTCSKSYSILCEAPGRGGGPLSGMSGLSAGGGGGGGMSILGSQVCTATVVRHKVCQQPLELAIVIVSGQKALTWHRLLTGSQSLCRSTQPLLHPCRACCKERLRPWTSLLNC